MGTKANTIENVPVATFMTSMGNGSAIKPLRELTCEITPTQSLNGYDKPWAGGGGKNKLPIADSASYETGGVTVSRDAQGALTFGGKATQAISIQFKNNFTLPAGSYIFSGGDSFNFGTGITIYIRDIDNASTLAAISAAGEQKPFELLVETNVRFYIVVQADREPSGTFYPMVRLSDTSADFEPWQNICSITGQTSVSVYHAGESLLPFPSAENGWKPGYFNTTGGIMPQSSINLEMYNEEYIIIPEGTTRITFTVRFSSDPPVDTNKYWKCLCFYDENKEFISRGGIGSPETYTFTVPANAVYFRATCRTFGMVEFLNLEYGTTQKTVVQLGQTVYGGILDVVSGTLTLTHRIVTIDQNVNRLSVATSSATGLYYCSCVPISDDDAGIITYSGGDLLCDTFNVSTQIAIGNTYLTGGGKTLVFVLPDQTIDDVAKARVWLTSNPVTWVYELATPQTVQLTGQQITTLMGQNNVWASTGDIKKLVWVSMTYDLLQVFINGVDITELIAFNGWERQRNDVDSPDAGRTLDGRMHRARVATKMRFNVTCRPLLSGEISTLESLIMPEYVTVKVIGDPYFGTWEKLCYVNNTSAKYLIRKKDGRQYWGGITFPIIEV